MGSLDPDTRCCYCAVNLAGYIPDGSAGPMRGDCMDEAAISPAHCTEVVRKRHLRLIAGLSRLLARAPSEQLRVSRDAHITIAEFLWWG